MFDDQSQFDVRCEWGLNGIRRIGASADIIVIVDVLSFSTCVDLAVSRGANVFPYRWKDDTAFEYARKLNAEFAASREEKGRFSLSPASMQNIASGTRIVLPSPNGSELTVQAATFNRKVLTGCFRNAQAVARFAATQGGSIAVIPAGERWPDESLRAAVEDFAAAGAILSSIPGSLSPEAQAAVAVWKHAKNDIHRFLVSCASGRELIERGFEEDFKLASDVNVSTAISVFHEGAYQQR